MSVVVSGTLKSPDGEAISGANITLTALTVSPDALSGTSASAVTREGGYYGMTMDPGEYAVSVTVKGKTAVYGRVRIEGTESTVTLNMLLRRSLVEVSIPGELLTDFRQIQNNVADDLANIRRLNEDTATKNTQATQSKESAAASAKSASDSAKTATSRAAEAGQKATDATEARDPLQSQQRGMQRKARPVPESLKKPPELMQKKPDSMLKRPGWRRRAPERSLSGQRLPLSVLKRPDVWLRMHGPRGLREKLVRRGMSVLKAKQVQWALKGPQGRKVSVVTLVLRGL